MIYHAQPSPLLDVYDRHAGFVCGVDFNLFVPGQIATASWDESMHIIRPPSLATVV